MGVTGAALFITLLAGPLAGRWIDRTSRPKFISWSRQAAALTALALAAIVATEREQAWHIVTAAFAIGLTDAAAVPARLALMGDQASPRMIPSANALSTAAAHGNRLVAPALTGLLIGLSGTAAALCFGAVLYAVSAILVLALTDQPRSGQSTFLEEIGHIRRQGALRGVLLVTVATNILVVPLPFAFLPVFAREVHGAGEIGLAWLVAASGAGALLGPAIVAARETVEQAGRWLLYSAVALAVSVLELAAGSWFALAVTAAVIAGGAGSVLISMQGAVVLLAVPAAMRGQASGWLTAANATLPAGMLLLGAAAAAAGLAVTTIIAGSSCAAALLFLVSRRQDSWGPATTKRRLVA